MTDPGCAHLQANSTKVQEDLEEEFQSLLSVLEELKEGMLMKIKQDRASRTYELQVWDEASLPPTGPAGSKWPRIFLQTPRSQTPVCPLPAPGVACQPPPACPSL